MNLRTALILGMIGLAVSVWVETWIAVQAKSEAEREWHRVTGTVVGLANPMRPDVKVEEGIEFLPPPAVGESSDERCLEMAADEGLRRFRRYVFLVDPVTHRARVAGVRFSPILLALLGLVYLGLAAAFYYVTSNRMTPEGASLAAGLPGEWVHFQPPPWHEPPVVSARSGTWSGIKWGLGSAVLIISFVMMWMSRTGTLLVRVGLGSVALFAAGVLGVCALNRATYRIEADSIGLRESSVVGWKVTPWPALRGAVEESVYHYSGGSPDGRRSPTLDHISQRVYFTDDRGEELVSIDDELVREQGRALLAHVLGRTGLHPEKRERGKR